MARKIELGAKYVKRSGLSGKTRQFTPSRDLGERVECVAEDNGRIVIIGKSRLYASERPTITDTDNLLAVSDTLADILEKLLERG